ncbi:MAG: HipA domain-containing protein [Spirochaetaceae bacterium]|nr:HipA domain-containing protein [Spirochaetaceae bacterium]
MGRNALNRKLNIWMNGAIDGHAKNFSIFLKARGRFRLTPLYDVMSAYPVIGKGLNEIPKQKIKMAMSVYGQNRHYKWNDITYDHWLSTAQQCGLDFASTENIIADLVGKTPSVLAEIDRIIPTGFPSSVSEKILSGLDKASDQLKSF